MQRTSEGKEDVYETFNILMRRKPKENNFKAVLETIRELMNTQCVVPNWLLDIILGYGDPGAAHYSKLKQPSAGESILGERRCIFLNTIKKFVGPPVKSIYIV